MSPPSRLGPIPTRWVLPIFLALLVLASTGGTLGMGASPRGGGGQQAPGMLAPTSGARDAADLAASGADALPAPEPLAGSGVSAAAAPTYQLTVFETGLPSASNWTSTVTNTTSGAYKTVNNDHNPHVYSEPNGSYEVQASSDNPHYAANKSAEFFSVNGTGLSLTFAFVFAYKVNFLSEALPLGTVWTIIVRNGSGGSLTSSTGTNHTSFTIPNGTFTFQVPSNIAGFLVVNPTGQFAIDGAGLNQSIVFAKLFRVTVLESGLPAASAWTTAVGNSTLNVSSTTLGTLLIFLEPNGTYWVRGLSSLPNYVPKNASIDLTVNGSASSLTVIFVQVGALGPGLPFHYWFPVAVVGAVIGAALICVGVALVRRRSRRRESAAPSGKTGAGTAPSGQSPTPATPPEAPQAPREGPP